MRTVLRKIFVAVRVSDEYRKRWNHELYKLCGDMDVVKCIKNEQIRWLGHVARMADDSLAMKFFHSRLMFGQRGTSA